MSTTAKSTRGLGMVDEIDKHLFIDEVRLTRLRNLTQESVTGTLRDLTNYGEHQRGSRIGHLRSLIKAVSGHFNVKLHLLVGDDELHSDAKNDHTSCFLGKGGQWSNGNNEDTGVLVCVHISES